MVDSIQVVVNDEVITKNEVANRVVQVTQNMKARNAQAQLPEASVMQRQVLEAMIVERAQLQLAKEMGVRVDDRTLDATIGRLQDVETRHPDGPFTAEAIYWRGMAEYFRDDNNPATAKRIWAEIQERFPNSEWARRQP